jgi:two-component system osmolarity sensor histidine kinase EnvZ
MTLLPRSLLWRTFILLAALVLATTAAWFEIFRAYELEPRARQVTYNLVSIVNLTRTALITSQPDRRHELLEELAEREGIQVYPSDTSEQTTPLADRPLMRLVTEAMRRQLGDNTRFASERDGKPGFWVTFHIDDDEYWVRVPRERVERRVALQWLGWGALALVLSLLAAYLIVSRVNRPLRALASAASVIGRERCPNRFPSAGPRRSARCRTPSTRCPMTWRASTRTVP